MNLRWKFLSLLSLIFSISILITFYFFWYTSNTVKNDALHDLELTADFIEKDLLNKQRENTVQAINFSLDGKLIDLFENFLAVKSLSERDKLHEYLSLKKEVYSIKEASITDLSGKILSSSDLGIIGKNVYFNDFKQSPDNKDVVYKEETTYASILDNNEVDIVKNTVTFAVPIFNFLSII